MLVIPEPLPWNVPVKLILPEALKSPVKIKLADPKLFGVNLIDSNVLLLIV